MRDLFTMMVVDSKLAPLYNGIKKISTKLILSFFDRKKKRTTFIIFISFSVFTELVCLMVLMDKNVAENIN